MLARGGVSLGRDYPRRVVTNLDEARRTSHNAVLDVRRGPGAGPNTASPLELSLNDCSWCTCGIGHTRRVECKLSW